MSRSRPARPVPTRPRLLAGVTVLALALAACGTTDDVTPEADVPPDVGTASDQPEDAGETSAPPADRVGTDGFPVTLEHAFGETVIDSPPERVAAVGGWTNQEAALALDVVPVGMPKMTWGDDDDNGLFPWVEDKLSELGAEAPVLFDETEGFDYEAVDGTDPDVILATYSGVTEEEYGILSEIAPVVVYADGPWATTWQDTTLITGRALGLEPQAEALVERVEDHLGELAAERPALAGTTVIVNRPDPSEVSSINFYTLHDPRAQMMLDLGLEMPQIVVDHTDQTEDFAVAVSAEQVDLFEDVDVIMSYGTPELLETLRSDPLTSLLPPIADDAYVILPEDTPLAASVSPSPLSLESDYTAELLDLLEQGALNAAP